MTNISHLKNYKTGGVPNVIEETNMVLLGKWVAPTHATMTEKHALSHLTTNKFPEYLVHEYTELS